jgi:hypothetical protein
MVAASIQGRDSFLQGAAERPDQITASSQGCLILNGDAWSLRIDSEVGDLRNWPRPLGERLKVRNVAPREAETRRIPLSLPYVNPLACTRNLLPELTGGTGC